MLLEPPVQLVTGRRFVTDINMEVVAMAEDTYKGLPIQHIAISQDWLLVMT
jgi:hypothetical protein